VRSEEWEEGARSLRAGGSFPGFQKAQSFGQVSAIKPVVSLKKGSPRGVFPGAPLNAADPVRSGS
jgi:hypothetical protein